MNIKKIKELVDLMNENDLTEIEVEQDGMKIRLIKKPGGGFEQVVTTVPVKQDPAAASAEAAGATSEKKNVKEVKAPMVGTFYRTSAPDEDPYVEVGDTIQKGEVLCIVEAMKLMNEVKAEFSGKIVEILAGNAEPVEYGQTLFLVEPV